MSGQLVGEVIAAADELRARGLSERGFHALIAIAEKASTHDRTATVRWDHVRGGLYGASKRTAERAVEDARKAGVIEVVRTGFRNQHGTSRAPVYRVMPLVDADTQVSLSRSEDHDTQVSASNELDTDKPELDTDKPSVDTDTQVSYLTFPYDGSIDGVRPRCVRHAHIANDADVPNCRDCQALRVATEARQQEYTRQLAADRADIRTAIDECDACDEYARLDDLTDCPKHPNLRRPSHEPP